MSATPAPRPSLRPSGAVDCILQRIPHCYRGFASIARLPRGTALTDDPGKCCEDPNTGFEACREGAGDLRFAGETPTVRAQGARES